MGRKVKTVITIAVVLLFFAVGILGAYFVGYNKSRGESVKHFKLIKPVSRGHELLGAYEESSTPSNIAIPAENLVISESELKGKVAMYDLYTNEPITKSSIGLKESVDRNLEFSLSTTVESSLANSINIDDIVAIKVKFQDNREDAVVVPSIPVSNIKQTNGQPISKKEDVPGFFLFNVTNQEQNDLNSASKEGILYVTRYRDLSQPKLQKTYIQGQAPNDSANNQTTTNTDKK
ncbi:hypothetical protein D3C81_569620 [compost metagenome]